MNTLHKTRFFSRCVLCWWLYIQNNKTKSLPFSLTLELKYVVLIIGWNEDLFLLSPNSVQRKGEMSTIETTNTLVIKITEKKGKTKWCELQFVCLLKMVHTFKLIWKNCRKNNEYNVQIKIWRAISPKPYYQSKQSVYYRCKNRRINGILKKNHAAFDDFHGIKWCWFRIKYIVLNHAHTIDL